MNFCLMGTLRRPFELSKAAFSPTVTNPFSFSELEKQKWSERFAASIKERNDFKQKFLRDHDQSVLNTNLNVKDKCDWDAKLKATKYTGGKLMPAQSELKKVLKRRKSRQSN